MLALLLACVPSGPGAAQTVSGIVKDRVTGRGLEGVRVRFMAPDDAPVLEVLTDEFGRFGRRTPDGLVTARLRVTAAGYRSWVSAELAPDRVHGLEILLLPFSVDEAELVARETRAAELARELTDDEVRARCGALGTRSGFGVVAGRVIEQGRAGGLVGIAVLAEWGSAPDPSQRLVVGGEAVARQRRAASGDGGRYQLCGIPAGVNARISVPGEGIDATGGEVTIGDGAVHRLDVVIRAGG